ncbi:Leucine Rich repeat, putative [Angomonas deanei]|uniref:Leucine Rich repeat, putative n=1 Tax=Angomonas deanei TaxID=59799 RepID=A0A7G2CQ25_9TRYP|nr:Leucine Rich repeat, putative [Angomonas deanei]
MPPKKRTNKKKGKRISSLRDLYIKKCKQEKIHANSGILELLSDDPTTFPFDTLDLQSNFIGNRGVVAVMTIIERSPNIRSLNLCDNGLRNSGVQYVCEGAARHPSLQSLNLSNNYISDGAADSLEKLLLCNARIVDLNILNTQISVERRVRLKDLAKNNLSVEAHKYVSDSDDGEVFVS